MLEQKPKASFAPGGGCGPGGGAGAGDGGVQGESAGALVAIPLSCRGGFSDPQNGRPLGCAHGPALWGLILPVSKHS